MSNDPTPSTPPPVYPCNCCNKDAICPYYGPYVWIHQALPCAEQSKIWVSEGRTYSGCPYIPPKDRKDPNASNEICFGYSSGASRNGFGFFAEPYIWGKYGLHIPHWDGDLCKIQELYNSGDIYAYDKLNYPGTNVQFKYISEKKSCRVYFRSKLIPTSDFVFTWPEKFIEDPNSPWILLHEYNKSTNPDQYIVLDLPINGPAGRVEVSFHPCIIRSANSGGTWLAEGADPSVIYSLTGAPSFIKNVNSIFQPKLCDSYGGGVVTDIKTLYINNNNLLCNDYEVKYFDPKLFGFIGNNGQSGPSPSRNAVCSFSGSRIILSFAGLGKEVCYKTCCGESYGLQKTKDENNNDVWVETNGNIAYAAWINDPFIAPKLSWNNDKTKITSEMLSGYWEYTGNFGIIDIWDCEKIFSGEWDYFGGIVSSTPYVKYGTGSLTMTYIYN